MAMSATARTLQRLRKDGITAQKVEYYQHCVGQKFGRRIDLFGSIDIVALLEGDIVGIQCTTVNGLSAHKRKIQENPEKIIEWITCRGRYVIHAWQKKGHRWHCRKIEAVLRDNMAEGLVLEPDWGINWHEDKSENRRDK